MVRNTYKHTNNFCRFSAFCFENCALIVIFVVDSLRKAKKVFLGLVMVFYTVSKRILAYFSYFGFDFGYTIKS